MTCTCACHPLEENHDQDDCYCMRITGIPKCQKCGIDLDFETDLCRDCYMSDKICGFCQKPIMKDEKGEWSDCSGYELRYLTTKRESQNLSTVNNK